MYKPLFLAGLLLLCLQCAFANDYDKAWEALHRNDRKKAVEYFRKALKNPTTAANAYITLVYLDKFDGNKNGGPGFSERIIRSLNDPNPYLYAMWFQPAALGEYGRKTAASQLDLLEEVFKNSRLNGSIKAAAHYVKGTHYMSSNDFAQALEEWKQVGSILNWQFAGPFENLSGTGFYKDHGPLAHPEAAAAFSGINKAPLHWFTPTASNRDAWKFVNCHVLYKTAIVFAQSFLYSPEEKDIVLNAGGSGSLKVWVNDALVIAASKERTTELDYYRSTCRLNKGYNRILVQIGFTGNPAANFIIRCTDKNGNAIDGLKETTAVQTYQKAAPAAGPEEIKHFAEVFFQEKIKAEPANPVNYILLTQTLLRNERSFEARKAIEVALKRFPDNSLLRFELIQCLLKEKDRTLLSQQVERIKEKDPDCLIAYQLSIRQLIDEEKYEEAEGRYADMIKHYAENSETIQTRIDILNGRKKYDEAIKLIATAYEKYPQSPAIVEMIFDVQKNAYKNIDQALDVYRRYLDSNFSFALLKQLGQEYMEQGKKDEGLACWRKLLTMFPYETELLTDLARYFYQQQDYKTADRYCDTVLGIAPFVANYWNNKGVITEQAGLLDDALNAYKKALLFDPNKYETRKKLRELSNKKDLAGQFPETDVYDLIKKSEGKEVSGNYGFSYLLNEKQVIAYGEGGVEEFCTLVVKINTEKGIDKWKESYISYNEYSQSLLIEKAEIVKKNGSKHQAEKNGNEVVFTSLEPGDAIVVKYRLQNYASGRLAADYWDRFLMCSFQPAGILRYSLLIDKSLPVKYEVTNSSLQPLVKEVDEFKLYTWQVNDSKPVDDEPYMPSLTDVSPTLHISTIPSWSKIVEWYSDLSHFQLEDEYELKEVYDSLFSAAGSLSAREKAEKIYRYVQQNIRYSHVPFRQGAYVPQRPSVTLNTRLGDCKDLSALFVSLAEMAGLKANLVLVSTRDNGLRQMTLPGLEFNHCIALVQVDGKPYYLELTDNELPFGSLPYNIPGAMSLLIPRYRETPKGELQSIVPANRTTDKITRKITISFEGADLHMHAEVVKTAAPSSSTRSSYKNLSPEKQQEKLRDAIAGSFKNPLTVSTVLFKDLDVVQDSICYSYSSVVRNELVEVGDMSMVRIPFGDIVATIDNFSKDSRTFPLEYWRYEDVDTYETDIIIHAPAGKKLMEMPASASYQFGASTYSLEFVSVNESTLQIKRRATLDRRDIGTDDYAAFKNFFHKIVKIESRYIAFK